MVGVQNIGARDFMAGGVGKLRFVYHEFFRYWQEELFLRKLLKSCLLWQSVWLNPITATIHDCTVIYSEQLRKT
jgi:hypothetical protein